MEDKLKQILADILNLDMSLINNNTSHANVNEWDSLKQINIVLALEEEFELEFNEDDIAKLTDFKSIKQVIEKNIRINYEKK